jgi:hypothetical protein
MCNEHAQFNLRCDESAATELVSLLQHQLSTL